MALPNMENVIKQGYLKKGNSTEGGMFSGIFDKMSSRKWYMLVVRNRIPYLEQYERDVDVFSSDPCEAYDLSVCTSICRTMASTARTYTFVIVCPDQLIELIAASREQMRDWCNALERTLNCLGFLKNDKEEHIYTFCPAVSNVVGHTQNKKNEAEEGDEALGAVGGAPAPLPPPRPAQPLPHPPSTARSSSNSNSDPPGSPVNNLSPLIVPSSNLRTASPSNSRTPSPSAGKPPPLPACPPPPLPPHPTSSGSIAPPLPVRASGGSLSSPPSEHAPPVPFARPLPTVPGANQQEKSLPLEPKKSAGTGEKADSSDSSDSDTDSSADFVSGAFWVINRKTPVPTARHVQLPLKPTSSSKTAQPVATTTPGAEGSSAEDDLDEGYSDLTTLNEVKQTHTVGPDGDVYTQVEKPATADREKGTEIVSQKENKGQASAGAGAGPVLDAKDNRSENTEIKTARDSNISAPSSSHVVSENTTVPRFGQDPKETQENLYSAFPGNSDNNTPAATTSEEHQNTTDNATGGTGGNNQNLYDVITMPKAVSAANHHSSTPLAGNDLETDNVYASAAEASSLPINPVPPLPERQDSLPSWRGDVAGGAPPLSADSVEAAASNGSAVSSGASLAEGARVRPVPARRCTVHPVSAALSQKSSVDTPPVPPRKTVSGSIIHSVKGLDLSQPPPLPARKAQSFRFQRPVSTSQLASEREPDEEAGEEGSSHPKSGSVQRQMSLGGSDVTENHLRMRMRLDHEHSVHSVVSLKQSQADILRQEMELPGVTVTTSNRAAQGIGLADCADAVCVVGWNQKDFPSLHGKFHIGDQLISICNVKVTSASMAQKMLKHPQGDLLEMLVKRIPYGCVLAIRRSLEGENIGIKRNGGTAEIQYVDPHGLAAVNGLASHAPAILPGLGRSHWMITEINSRPLSLFFKDNEIEHRLNAVGREITLVVQPADYIGELKRQLKKLKNYKSFIVQ